MNKNIYISQERFKSYNHDVYTEEVSNVVAVMIKNYKHLIGLQNIHMEQTFKRF